MLESELHKKVADELGIDLERVIAYDKEYWKNVKWEVNNPTWDVLELPFLGSFTITPAKMRSSLRYSLRILKRMRDKIKREAKAGKTNTKLIRDFDVQKELFKNLWKLKQELI